MSNSHGDGNSNGSRVIPFPIGKPRSSLTRLQPQEPASDDELHSMRRAAWRKQGVVVLRPEDISDEWVRQAVINEATRRYGRRDNGSTP